MAYIIEPETIAISRKNKKPVFYQSMAGNALQDRLGSKNTYSGFMKIVQVQDLTIYAPSGRITTTVTAHRVVGSIPFVFLYLKKAGFYNRAGFVDNSGFVTAIFNPVVDDKNYTVYIYNEDPVNDQTLNFRAVIFEVTN